jgi:hypothetical protein
MKIYAIIGSNAVTTDCTSNPKCPAGHIEMTGRRPTPEHVAQADGTWAIPLPSPAELQAKYLAAVDERIVTIAHQRGYDSIDSAAKYIGNTRNPVWAAEGEALRDWTIEVYETCYAIMGQVMAGEYPLPSVAGLFEMLPDMVWPDGESVPMKEPDEQTEANPDSD